MDMELPEALEDLIATLQLEPLSEEGGWFRRIYEAELAWPGDDKKPPGRKAGSAIYYAIRHDQPSLLHRIWQDELYIFLGGNPARFTLLTPGAGGRQSTLGPPADRFLRIPGNSWQGLEVLPHGSYEYSLFCVTVIPEFHYADREMGQAAILAREFPGWSESITRLTP